MIRTRFAPSPTGYMHIGNLRTALYAYLFAKHGNGTFVLRIEDTDQERFVEGSIDLIYKTFQITGLNHDEGPDKGGKYGPYVQSERKDLYVKYAKKLVELGGAYYCFCKNQPQNNGEESEEVPEVKRHSDPCRKLSKDEADKRVAGGEIHVIRQRIEPGQKITYKDLVFGLISIDSDKLDEGVLFKSNGLPTYNFANVIDDHLMEITHIIRGSEYLSSTPKYILIYQAFGWSVPEHIHLPPIIKQGGKKLSKRAGDPSFMDLLDDGYLKDAVINYIAMLGWNPGGDEEIFSLPELVQKFTVDGIHKAPAIFDVVKLDWMNKVYMKKKTTPELVEIARPWLAKLSVKDPEILTKAVELERERITKLSELPAAVKFVFELPDYQKELLVWRKGTLEEVKKVLPELRELLDTFSVQQWNKAELEHKVGEWIKEKGYSVGGVLWPLRTALSGQQNSPGPYEIAEVLGKEETLNRVDIAINKLMSSTN